MGRFPALAVLALVLAAVQGKRQGDVTASHASLSVEEEAAKNRPVSKVITLLKDMLKQLEKEASDDEEIYDKLACWCKTNDREKTKAIKEAEVKIEDLTTKIEELTASSARLNTEIKNTEKEVAANQASLDKATALREKQLAEFNAEEKDLLESVSALKAAITVLSKHHTESLMQMPRSHMLSVAATLQHEMQKHSSLLDGVISPSQRRAVTTFVQAPDDYFDASPTFKQSYAPQSGEIFGILRQMLETFESNLSEAQKEELANQKAYEDLKAAKEGEIQAGQAQIDTKTQELATTDEKNAQSKEDKEDTKASLSADEQFLMMLKEKCQMTDAEWEERQKTRQLEMEAVSKALAILSGDDAHDLFTRTFNPSLLQRAGAKDSKRRAAASRVLAAAAQKTHNPRLSNLAYRVRLDAFTRVKKAIDDMIAQLTKEKEDEIKHKDFCVDEFNSNQLQTEKKEREKEDLLAKIADLEQTIQALTAAITSLKEQIAEMQVQMKRAGEDREKENKEFQTTVADQRETQKLLAAALSVLQDFYGKKEAALMQQKQEPVGPPPPPGFEAYKKSAASSGVLGLIKQIISDAKAMEAETIRSEEDAQKAYEEFVKETNASIEAKSKEIVNKSEEKATAESDLVETKESKDAVMLELEQLSNYNAQLHQSCDFVVKNFEVRQTARDEEVEALKQPSRRGVRGVMATAAMLGPLRSLFTCTCASPDVVDVVEVESRGVSLMELRQDPFEASDEAPWKPLATGEGHLHPGHFGTGNTNGDACDTDCGEQALVEQTLTMESTTTALAVDDGSRSLSPPSRCATEEFEANQQLMELRLPSEPAERLRRAVERAQAAKQEEDQARRYLKKHGYDGKQHSSHLKLEHAVEAAHTLNGVETPPETPLTVKTNSAQVLSAKLRDAAIHQRPGVLGGM